MVTRERALCPRKGPRLGTCCSPGMEAQHVWEGVPTTLHLQLNCPNLSFRLCTMGIPTVHTTPQSFSSTKEGSRLAVGACASTPYFPHFILVSLLFLRLSSKGRWSSRILDFTFLYLFFWSLKYQILHKYMEVRKNYSFRKDHMERKKKSFSQWIPGVVGIVLDCSVITLSLQPVDSWSRFSGKEKEIF